VRGKPIVIFDPRSKLSRALHQIALRIEGEPATEKSLFSRISGLFSRKEA
ncbi:MAG: septum site-determining protein MinD, partial [Methanobacteriota archaeon]